MISLKCKSCGEIIPVDSNESSVTCPSCGNVYSVPMDEKKEQFLNLYSRADDAWDHKDFEEASDLYQQILDNDNAQSEAHFGLVLCKYGITYEIDPVTQKKMPTCNRINRDSILDDKHYQAAIKYANKDAAASFQKRAKEIDRISRDFLKIVDKEPPYDVFISYKRTAEDNSLTQDSKVARKLYFFLKDKGFKVFFAEETLKSIAGEQYEPYIFAALSSAPVMVLVGSKRDHFDATWVKNEWRRYLVLMNQGLKKTLIPAYFDMDPYHMPGELRNLQAMNATDFTFHEDITEIIRKKIADAKDGTTAAEPQGQSLKDKYAPKDKVEKVLALTDCDREFAVNVLIRCYGDVKKSQQYIEEDPGYKKSLWICTECNTKNTHDKCRGCGVTKKESQEVDRARKEMQERELKKSAAYKRRRAAKIKKIVVPIIILAALASLFAFVIWPMIVYPNLSNPNLHTPEIVQTYCGTWDNSTKDEPNKWDYIFTITSCDANGNVTATREFVHNNVYGKYNLTGKIIKKKNNGKMEITFQAQSWEIQPEGYEWTASFTAKIKDNYTTFSGDNLWLKAGSNDNYDIKTASDLQKLTNSNGFYMLKNDIDLTGKQWTPIEGFSGTLLGNGYTIKGLTISASNDNVGFFSVLNGVVNNVKFENANITVSGRYENVGILCGKLEKGNVINVSTAGKILADTCSGVGGVIGCVALTDAYQLTSLTNAAQVTGLNKVGGVIGNVNNVCKQSTQLTVALSKMENSGAITGKGDDVGGVIGYLAFDNNYGDLILHATSMKNTGSVTAKGYAGGVFGYAQGDGNGSYIQDCSSASAVTAESHVGCIAGKLVRVSVKNCSNEGSTIDATGHITIEGEKYAYLGGIVGYGYIANNCENKATINYSGTGRYVGGIMGYANAGGELTMSGLKNSANISGYSYVGGIFGRYQNVTKESREVPLTLSQFENTATVSGKSDFVGGIAGQVELNNEYGSLILYATNMKNSGAVSGVTYTGGLFGYAISDSTSSYMQDCSCTASVTGESYVGCMAGRADYITINDCTNTGSTLTATGHTTIDGEKYAYVGGFVGFGYLANNCTNEVAISYEGEGRFVGGIIGFSNASEAYSMEGLKNTASISGYSHVGGIIGASTNKCQRSTSLTVNISRFENSGTVKAKSNYAGGLIGHLSQDNGYGDLVLYLTDSKNTGEVSAKSSYGGILGYGQSDSENSAIRDCTTSTGNIAGNLEKIKIM